MTYLRFKINSFWTQSKRVIILFSKFSTCYFIYNCTKNIYIFLCFESRGVTQLVRPWVCLVRVPSRSLTQSKALAYHSTRASRVLRVLLRLVEVRVSTECWTPKVIYIYIYWCFDLMIRDYKLNIIDSNLIISFNKCWKDLLFYMAWKL